jgi:AcrR family transcriptional regulator
MRRKLTPRGRERREQLITCAARLFAERGYHPTSVADIVASLGVGKGVFYWYFASKEELLSELLKAANHELRKRQQSAIGDEQDRCGESSSVSAPHSAGSKEHREILRDHPVRGDRRDVSQPCSRATGRSRSTTRSVI